MITKTAKMAFVCSALLTGTLLVRAEQATPATAPTSNAAPVGPKIQFDQAVYDFGKVKSGDPVKHTFIFTNVGTETLFLTNVQPSCGCTTAGEWSRQVEPGKTGTIPIQFNSANYGGSVLKTVTVTSNDKSQPSVGLQVKGTVWKPIDVNPQFAVMTIPADTQTNVMTKVHIVNNMEEAITLSPPESNNKSFTAELKTNTVGKDFDMIITAQPPFEQPNLQGQVTIKTSSTNMPSIAVTAWANVLQAVVVTPPQVMLAAGPLANKQTITVSIQNNGAKPIKVSEPAIDSQGVDVQLTESNPGRTFSATLNFPQGYELTPGTKAEFTVKTDHPKYPVIKVPVSQMAKPALPVVQPAAVPLTPAATPAGSAPATVKTSSK